MCVLDLGDTVGQPLFEETGARSRQQTVTRPALHPAQASIMMVAESEDELLTLVELQARSSAAHAVKAAFFLVDFDLADDRADFGRVFFFVQRPFFGDIAVTRSARAHPKTVHAFEGLGERPLPAQGQATLRIKLGKSRCICLADPG